MNKITLEVCVDSVESALAAQKGGATRLEVCSNLIIGGTTPTSSLIDLVNASVDIPLHVLIRPRFGDFCYTPFEFEYIKREIKVAKEHGAKGIVIGILTPNGDLDIERLKVLIDLAKPLHITLHRAFDVCKNPFEALEQVKSLGIDTILTSGQQQTCIQGASCIKELVNKAGNQVEILVGSGLNSSNIEEIVKTTHAKAYHLSGKKEKESPMLYRPQTVTMGLPILSEYTIWETDWLEIEKVKDIINRIHL
ncbi:copper homeostasis protein CutC [Cellulosilyticum sp. I15G10I2]|uniref:copper homeostasis protein CutC n=1 Tax=Cellulosilyticum sp. I15G10I2 TaxID=1892843 RepID=UPI00085C9342|nr:copper homeostasis protein CutC [Cellulosilyticum sp. I15G10I2]